MQSTYREYPGYDIRLWDEDGDFKCVGSSTVGSACRFWGSSCVAKALTLTVLLLFITGY